MDDHHGEIKGVPGFEQETKQNKHKLRTKVYNYNQYYTDGGVYQNVTMCTRVWTWEAQSSSKCPLLQNQHDVGTVVASRYCGGYSFEWEHSHSPLDSHYMHNWASLPQKTK